MKLPKSLFKPLLLSVILLGSMGSVFAADEPTTVRLTLHPQAIEEHGPWRTLLPEAPDLKPGNAAVVLLRMPWEQQKWMQEWLPKVYEVSELPPGDPRVGEFAFGNFAHEMRRAAFIRDADWNYPVDDEPLDEILLPDAQGLRLFVGYGMSIWVSQRIAAADFDGAREGVLVQFACARHAGRAQFVVNQLIAANIATHGLDSLERVLGAPGSPNLHNAIHLLPHRLGRGIEALQWEAVSYERSLPMLRDGIPAAGDGPAWTQVMDSLLERWMRYEGTPTPERSVAIWARIVAAGRTAFSTNAQPDLDLATASDDEIAMRFLLVTFRQIHQAAESAWRLEGPEAIAALVELDGRDDELPPALREELQKFLPQPLRSYLAIHHFGRRARMLEVVEALRDALARSGGRFPPSLADVPARVPLDPFTGRPFIYEPAADGRSARLATPPIPGVDEPRYSRIYELTIAEPE